MGLVDIYYLLRPLIPRAVQFWLRRQRVRFRMPGTSKVWPIDHRCATPPSNWPGWPDGKQWGLVLTHDVETQVGHDKCIALSELEKKLGFRSSFNFVPERYQASSHLRETLASEGFEIGVHGLMHDGKLFKNYETFRSRARKINQHLSAWGACGFRAPAMHHDLRWLHRINAEYDASTFDTDPFEPQPDGLQTIFPVWIPSPRSEGGYVELPYTLPQDSTLFLFMDKKEISIWKRKVDWIAGHGGMVLLITHPDYMRFPGEPESLETFPVSYYEELLNYIKGRYKDTYWHGLPRDVAAHVKPHQPRLPASNPLLPERRKKIAMVVLSVYPGDPRVRREAESLTQEGYQVDVICLQEEDTSPRETVKDVRVHRLPLQHERGNKLRYLFEYSFFLLRAGWLLTRLHRKERYDLIYIHNMPNLLVFTALAARGADTKVILDMHDPMPELYQAKFGVTTSHPMVKLLALEEKASVRFADGVITTNKAFVDLFVGRGCSRDKLSVVMNAPQEDIFNETRKTPIPDSTPRYTMMFHGVIVERNGLDTAVRAMAMALSDIPQLEFEVYSDGPHLPVVKDLVRDLGLEERVRYHGSVSLEKIAEAIIDIHVGVVPNRQNPFTNENFPTRIFEYLSLGRPVIAPRTRGVTDYFQEEELFFFEPENEKDMARALVEVYQDTEKRDAIMERAYAVYQRHRWTIQRQELYRAVHELARP